MHVLLDAYFGLLLDFVEPLIRQCLVRYLYCVCQVPVRFQQNHCRNHAGLEYSDEGIDEVFGHIDCVGVVIGEFLGGVDDGHVFDVIFFGKSRVVERDLFDLIDDPLVLLVHKHLRDEVDDLLVARELVAG